MAKQIGRLLQKKAILLQKTAALHNMPADSKDNKRNNHEGVSNMRKYSGLNDLLGDSKEASAYFASLPAYVQEAIRQRADNINSFASLKTYAGNLTQGDD